MDASGNGHMNVVEFITVRVCNSYMVSIPTIWIGCRQSAVNMLSRYLIGSHSRCWFTLAM